MQQDSCFDVGNAETICTGLVFGCIHADGPACRFKDAWFVFDFVLVWAMIAENGLAFGAYLFGADGGFNFSWLAVRWANRCSKLLTGVRWCSVPVVL